MTSDVPPEDCYCEYHDNAHTARSKDPIYSYACGTASDEKEAVANLVEAKKLQDWWYKRPKELPAPATPPTMPAPAT